MEVIGEVGHEGDENRAARDAAIRAWLVREPVVVAERRPAAGPGPASPEQRRMFLQQELAPADQTDIVPLAWHIDGDLAADRLECALRHVVDRRDALRSTLERAGDVVLNVVAEQGGFRVRHERVAARPGAARSALTDAVVAAHARPMSLGHDALVRAVLIRASPTEHALLVDVHHAMVDGWSLRLIAEEIWSTYDAMASNRPVPMTLPPQYADYARQRASTARPAARDHWARALRGAPATSTLPTKGALAAPATPTPAAQGESAAPVTFAASGVDFAIPEPVYRQLRAVAVRHSATPLMVLMAAYQITLCQFAGQSDMVVCTPAARRDDPAVTDLVGLLVNMLPIRGVIGWAEPFSAVLARIRTALLDGLRHQDVSFEDIVAASGVPRLPYRPPLAQTAIVLQDTPAGPMTVGGLTVRPIDLPTEAVRWDLVLTMAPTGGELRGSAIYRRELLGRPAVSSFLSAFLRNLERATGDPDRTVQEIVRLPPPLVAEQVRLGRGPVTTTPPGALDRLVDLSAFAPGSVVLVGPDGRRYRREEVTALVATLRRQLQGRPGRVGVLLGHEPAAVVAMLAIWRCGATFVPLDPSHPFERLRWICSDAAITRCLVSPDARAFGRDVAGPGVELLDVPVAASGHPAATPGSAVRVPVQPAAGGVRDLHLGHRRRAEGRRGLVREPGAPRRRPGRSGCRWSRRERLRAVVRRLAVVDAAAADPRRRGAACPVA